MILKISNLKNKNWREELFLNKIFKIKQIWGNICEMTYMIRFHHVKTTMSVDQPSSLQSNYWSKLVHIVTWIRFIKSTYFEIKLHFWLANKQFSGEKNILNLTFSYNICKVLSIAHLTLLVQTYFIFPFQCKHRKVIKFY